MLATKRVVNVEAVVRDTARSLLLPQNIDALHKDINRTLRMCPAYSNGAIQLGDSTLSSVLESLYVCDLPEGVAVDSIAAELCIHAFALHRGEPEKEYLEGDEEVCASEQWRLPHAAIAPLWDSIIVEAGLKERLLGYCASAMLFAARGVDPGRISWNRMVLLHGPPGTGKTTLCKALAQRVFLRSRSSYDSGVLVEINTHSLFSRFFSESGKLVLKLFEYVEELCQDKRAFVAVLIDEVESLVLTRNTSGSEPADAVRVVNAVLTSLDALKRRPNALVLCTSNLAAGIDPAFRDRCDLALLVGNPCSAARAQILVDCLQELADRGIVVAAGAVRAQLEAGPSPMAQQFRRALLLSSGLSGRQLRKAPLRAHAFFLRQPSVSLAEFVTALSALFDAGADPDVTRPATVTVETAAAPAVVAVTAAGEVEETRGRYTAPPQPLPLVCHPPVTVTMPGVGPPLTGAAPQLILAGAHDTGSRYSMKLAAFMQEVTFRGPRQEVLESTGAGSDCSDCDCDEE